MSWGATARASSKRLGRRHGGRAYLIVVESVENVATMAVTQTATAHEVYLRTGKRHRLVQVNGSLVGLTEWDLILAADELSAAVRAYVEDPAITLRILSPADDEVIESSTPEALASVGSVVILPQGGRETDGRAVVYRLRKTGGAYTPPSGYYRVTPEGDYRVTGDGDARVTP